VKSAMSRRGISVKFGSVLVACAVFVSVGALSAPSAQAWDLVDFHLRPFEGSPSAHPPSGHTNQGTVRPQEPGIFTQAGGHPNIYTKFTVDNHDEAEARGEPEACACGDAQNVTVSLPAGVIGSPNNVPRCSLVDFGNNEDCSPDSQVGVATPALMYSPAYAPFNEPGHVFYLYTPIYNLEPGPGQAGLLGFYLPLVNEPGFIVLSARTGGDYGLDATAVGIEHLVPIDGFATELWGVPAESKYDVERCTSIEPHYFQAGECGTTGPSNAELKPFLDSPTTCAGSLLSHLEVQFYNEKVTFENAPWPGTTGCDQLTYNPSLYAQPTTTATDSPSGLDIDLRVPQLQSPTAPSPSETRATSVTLPMGMAINSNAGDGRSACSDAQARFGTEEEAHCPESAKIGTLSLTSTALPGPMPGAIYLGEPKPGDPYRVILTANGFATHIKLAGSVRANSETGQLVASFQDLPQAPFSDLNLHFFGSERGPIATPASCGTYSVASTFTPWDGALSTQTSTQFFTLNSGPDGRGCPASTRPFSPSFEAGIANPTAGVHSPFFVHLTRSDGDQNLARLTVLTPPGFSASLKGIPYCSDVALAAAASPTDSGVAERSHPSCPAASLIGEATAAAGAGSHPVYLPGKVYLAGPYKGAPISLAVITPAVSGPYDLGDVVVRAALHLNPESAQVTAVSDPLPQILEGVPLRLRSILVNLDRPDFALNPTNCDPFSVESETLGDQGTAASASSHFQVSNCAGLPFAPKLSLKLTGGVRRRGHPAIHAVLRANPGEANIHSVSVTLPQGELLDNAHIGAVCTRPDFARGTCPASSLIGQAEISTPLLDQPLKGAVYLRSSKHELPDLALDLSGQVDIEAVGRIDSVKGRLRTRFESIPDVPISRVALDLAGGSKGLLANSETLCAKAKRASVKMVGQNGAHLDSKATLQVSCKGARQKRHSQRAKGAR
jgi:hypothetical protein